MFVLLIFIFLFISSIVDPPPQVDVDLVHLPPALVNEYYRLHVVITNRGDKVESGSLFLKYSKLSEEHQKCNCNFFTESLDHIPDEESLPIESLESNETKQIPIFLLGHSDSKTLSITLSVSKKAQKPHSN